jgi:hypothetical protein
MLILNKILPIASRGQRLSRVPMQWGRSVATTMAATVALAVTAKSIMTSAGSLERARGANLASCPPNH